MRLSFRLRPGPWQCMLFERSAQMAGRFTVGSIGVGEADTARPGGFIRQVVAITDAEA